MGTLREVKHVMRKNEELRDLLVRSSRHELLIDLDGDKVADIALIDTNHDGDIDTFAVDATGNGDFNLYVGDSDANGAIDTVEIYDDDDDMPIASFFGRAVEDRFIELGNEIYSRIVAIEAGRIVAAELISAFKKLVSRAEEEYKKVEAEEKKEEENKEEKKDE